MSNVQNYECLIARYLNGELSSEDEEQLLLWIEKHPQNKELFMSVKDAWDVSAKVNEQELLLQSYKRLTFGKSRNFLPAWIKVAAAAAILVVVFLAGHLFQQNPPVANQIQSLSVSKGSRSEILLADGTKIFLNSDSRLTIGNQFSPQARTVSLDGEAYFEIAADPEHPFVIMTDKFNVEVTGTKLNVYNYKEDETISTTLVEGKASVTTKNNATFKLSPGEKISFDFKTMNPSIKQVDVVSEIAWIKNEFLFKDIPFPELIHRLERWYDVKLVYREEEFNTIFHTGSFKNQETIWQVLDALKLTSPIDYKKIGFREFEIIYKPI